MSYISLYLRNNIWESEFLSKKLLSIHFGLKHSTYYNLQMSEL